MKKGKASIIIPCFNEEQFIERTVNLALSQDYEGDLEVIIADGLSTDKTPQILERLSKEDNRVKYIENPDKTVPFAFNLAIPKSSGDYIVILGAHSEIPANYVSRLVDALEKYEADNVGGVLETVAPDSSEQSMAIALACSSKIGMGNSQFRIGSDKIKEVDTVPFGCYRREVFDKIGFFDTELTRNQDDEFNSRLLNHGGKIILIPDLKLKYYARDNYRKLWRMFYQYGLFKPVVSAKIGKPTTMRQLVPPLFVLSVITLMAAGFYHYYFWLLLIIELVLYETMLSISAVKMQKQGFSFGVFGHFIISVYVIHFAYGVGYLKGLWKYVITGQKPSSSNFKTSR